MCISRGRNGGVDITSQPLAGDGPKYKLWKKALIKKGFHSKAKLPV